MIISPEILLPTKKNRPSFRRTVMMVRRHRPLAVQRLFFG